MQIAVHVGDVLAFPADVLISTANPWLNLSGGVNGAILTACGSTVQDELHAYLEGIGASAVPAGSVIRSQSANLPFKHILHAVAIDPFYDSSVELVRKTFAKALEMTIELGATTISSPTLATGYGPLSIADFGCAISPLSHDHRFSDLKLAIVVRSDKDADTLRLANTIQETEQ